MAGSLVSFWYFNMFPAKIFEGNVGSMCIGATIGSYLVINNYYFFGIIILLPHIINYLMDFWTFKIKNREDIKFGSVDENGFIVVPKEISSKSIKFFICYNYNLDEKSAVYIIYLPSILCAILGLIIA